MIYSFLMIHLDLENLSCVAKKFCLINLEESHDLAAIRHHMLFRNILYKRFLNHFRVSIQYSHRSNTSRGTTQPQDSKNGGKGAFQFLNTNAKFLRQSIFIQGSFPAAPLDGNIGAEGFPLSRPSQHP